MFGAKPDVAINHNSDRVVIHLEFPTIEDLVAAWHLVVYKRTISPEDQAEAIKKLIEDTVEIDKSIAILKSLANKP